VILGILEFSLDVKVKTDNNKTIAFFSWVPMCVYKIPNYDFIWIDKQKCSPSFSTLETKNYATLHN